MEHIELSNELENKLVKPVLEMREFNDVFRAPISILHPLLTEPDFGIHSGMGLGIADYLDDVEDWW